ncbi:hypothetical protein DPEC_G00088130 [Dallia pectoralis]|uniref:Uncharacterized protein n=1 Tax=Dallia pectoralis TaxID=75939 RepID=A0ACC2H142_DALPE|nr:hypothetical protein DPEC_G00088130 [Dallia pectoralis]
MGNFAGKDGHGLTGSRLDMFHTPPSSPSDLDLAVAHLLQQETSSPGSARGVACHNGASAITKWSHTLSVPPEWAVISLDSSTSPQGAGMDMDEGRRRMERRSSSHNGSPVSPCQGLPTEGSPLGQSWQERDSGLEPQGKPVWSGDELALVLTSLLEHHRSGLVLTPGLDPSARATELLKQLMMEREDLVEEVHNLKDTLKTERAEWHQFQCDLQVAVSVADRLRLEAEETLGTLQHSHIDVEGQLARAHTRQQDTDTELESLRAEHTKTCQQLSALTLEHQQVKAELDTLRQKETAQREKEERPPAEDLSAAEAPNGRLRADSEGEKAVEKLGEQSPENVLKGRGVAETYLRNLAAAGEKGCVLRDPRRIVMMTERSRSLCRLPQATESLPAQTGSPQTTISTRLPLYEKEEATKGSRMDHILQRQESWSSFTKKHEEDQNSDPFFSFRPQDGFSMLLRRHGGSRRNSLLRWCQSRTRGYKHVEITNFSSSWEDGLAFCAVYHTYLPTHIPFGHLSPEDKKENLDIAFRTGESVGILATLTVEEMLKPDGPDWQRVLGYIESMFRHFEM